MPKSTLSRYSTVFNRRRSLIPATHRAYFESHPLGFCVAVGFAISGVINIAFPHLVRESAVSIALPWTLYYVFSVMWAVGGCASSWGLLRGVRNLEAGGDVLIATTLVVNYISVVWVRTTTALAALFLVFLALGFLLRARHLAKSGYIVVALALDDVPRR